jgi:predicted translin family RNA/ssDNA-binding protein
MEFIPAWLVPLGSALAAGLSIWNFVQSPSKRNADEIGALRASVVEDFKKIGTRLGEAERRIDTIDTIIKQLPDKDSFHALDNGLTEVRGKIDTITQTLKATSSSLERIENFLINSATKG